MATPAPEVAADSLYDADDRVLTAANVVTVIRLIGIAVFCWMLFGAGEQTGAAVLLGVLGSTDWVDGQLARRLGQVSTLGKVLDPAVDRVLIGTAVVAVIVHGAAPVWFGVLTIAREALVSVTVLTLASLGARRVDVLWIGKAGAFALMVSYPAFLISDGTASWQEPFHVIAWISGIIGLAMAWGAAAAYIAPARQALALGRSSRTKGRGK